MGFHPIRYRNLSAVISAAGTVSAFALSGTCGSVTHQGKALGKIHGLGPRCSICLDTQIRTEHSCFVITQSFHSLRYPLATSWAQRKKESVQEGELPEAHFSPSACSTKV